MSQLRRVNPPSLARPSGFSHAVVATGTTVHLAGQTALDADGAVVGDGVVEQFERALTNLLTALDAAGGAPRDRAPSMTSSSDASPGRSYGAYWTTRRSRQPKSGMMVNLASDPGRPLPVMFNRTAAQCL